MRHLITFFPLTCTKALVSPRWLIWHAIYAIFYQPADHNIRWIVQMSNPHLDSRYKIWRGYLEIEHNSSLLRLYAIFVCPFILIPLSGQNYIVDRSLYPIKISSVILHGIDWYLISSWLSCYMWRRPHHQIFIDITTHVGVGAGISIRPLYFQDHKHQHGTYVQ